MNADVLVVGASVAGLAAAEAAASAGAKTLVVERRPEAWTRPAPMELALDPLWPTRPEFDECTVAHYEAIRVLGRDGDLRIKLPARLYERPRLEKELARRAKAAGAQIVRDLERLRPAHGGVSWLGGDAQGEIVVYADETDTLARQFVEPVRDPGGARFATTWNLPPVATTNGDVEVALGRHAPGGRSQLCPFEDLSVLTIFYQDPRADPAALLDGTLERHRSLRDTGPGQCVLAGPPAVDPSFMLPGQLSADGLVVAGGAAGQAGIELGIEAGRAAGAAAARGAKEGRSDAARLRDLYEDPWKARRQRSLERWTRIHERLVRGPAYRLEALVNAWAGATIPWRELAAAVGLVSPRGKFGRLGLLLRHPAHLAGWTRLMRLGKEA